MFNQPNSTIERNPMPAPHPEKGFYIPKNVREERRAETMKSIATAPATASLMRRRRGGAPTPGGPVVERGERLLTVNQVALRLQIEKKAIYQMIKNGQLPAFNLGKRMWRIEESALSAFLMARKCESRRVLELDGEDLDD